MLSLEQALVVPDLPEISQTILNLAEFMEHCDKAGYSGGGDTVAAAKAFFLHSCLVAQLPYEPSYPVGWLVGLSACHNFLKGREVILS